VLGFEVGKDCSAVMQRRSIIVHWCVSVLVHVLGMDGCVCRCVHVLEDMTCVRVCESSAIVDVVLFSLCSEENTHSHCHNQRRTQQRPNWGPSLSPSYHECRVHRAAGQAGTGALLNG
jgi:hypothetical protein